MELDSSHSAGEQYWQLAASRLAIKVITPFCLSGPSGLLKCTAFVPHFGNEKGTAVIVKMSGQQTDELPALKQLAEENSVAFSMMFAQPEFRLTEFKEALLDWGYFGPPESCPRWIDVWGSPQPPH